MNLISLDSVSKTLKDAPLFEGLTLGIDSGDKIGLVGRNGCGKSTLLSLLSGALPPDEGSVARKRGLSISILDQNALYPPRTSLRDFLYLSGSPLATLVRDYEACLAAHEGTAAHDSLLDGLSRRMEAEGGFDFERAYVSLLSELGLEDLEASMDGFSGGMAKKAALARCLAEGSELVLMDEPTNHLDIDTIEWLEAKLSNASFALVLVTHDRYFLEAVCGRILEIDRQRVFSYPGDYAAFLEKRAERLASLEQSDARRLSILRDELEWLKRGPKARGGKSKSRKQRIDGLLKEGLEREEAMEGFAIPLARQGKKILALKGIAKSYGPLAVIKEFSREFTRGERIGVIGPNGSGKSTFLDLLAGKTAPDGGRIDKGENTVFAYFEQDGSGMEGSSTVLEYLRQKAERVAMSDGYSLSAEQFLERFLFPRSMFDQRLDTLSGGELRRLQLIRLLASGANFLLLDEPTNDFDVLTIALLEDFLIGFPGCVLTVSHDRAFLDRVTDSLLVFDGSGEVRGFVGDYSDYREETLAKAAQAKAAASIVFGRVKRSGKPSQDRSESGGGATAVPVAEPTTAAAGIVARPATPDRPKPKLSFNEKKELDGILDAIADLEAERDSLEASFSDSSLSPAELARLGRRYELLLPLIEEKTHRWADLSDRES